MRLEPMARINPYPILSVILIPPQIAWFCHCLFSKSRKYSCCPSRSKQNRRARPQSHSLCWCHPADRLSSVHHTSFLNPMKCWGHLCPQSTYRTAVILRLCRCKPSRQITIAPACKHKQCMQLCVWKSAHFPSPAL